MERFRFWFLSREAVFGLTVLWAVCGVAAAADAPAQAKAPVVAKASPVPAKTAPSAPSAPAAPAGAAQVSVASSDASSFVPDPAPAAPTSSKGDSEDYVLQPGDRVKITIYPEDEYVKGGEMQVSTEGKIALPLVGKIDVGGKSVKDAESNIRKIVDADYLVNPEIVIEVIKQSELSQIAVVVLGAVKKPGSYQFPVGEVKMTLLRAISEAGGFSDVANIGKIKIVRQEEGEKKVIKADAEDIISGDEPDVELKSGDIIHIAESLF